MPYQTLDLPFGMHANGTQYQNRGKWYDGNRIRWHDDALLPIGGWQRFTDDFGVPFEPLAPTPATDLVRALEIWSANDGAFTGVAGHNSGLSAFRLSSSVIEDITPVGFVPRTDLVVSNTGYGGGFYGIEAYGTARSAPPAEPVAFNWCFRLFGDNLLASERVNPSSLYQWVPGTPGTPAVIVPGAPTDFDCHHVTSQRIAMVAGQPTDPRLVQWSDSEDITDWTPATTNQAGFQRLDGIGRFKEIVTVRDQILLLSTTDAWLCRYIGPPYIFGFDRVSDQTGVFSGPAVAVTEDFAVWPGPGDFFVFDGSSVKRLDCPLTDRLPFMDNPEASPKITAHIHPDFSEVWWLYEDEDSANGEPNRYVVWDFIENHWATGALDRTVGGGHPRLGGPFMVTHGALLFQHERDGVLPLEDGEPSSTIFAESGPIEIGRNGFDTQYVKYIQPDFIASGQCNVSLIGQDRPGGPETTFGPYQITYPAQTRQPIPTRARGHTVRLRVEGSNQNWTLGSLRLDLETGGQK